MDDINKMLNEARAAAAREQARRYQEERAQAMAAWVEAPEAAAEEPTPEPVSSGVGVLEVARRQGRWRCYLDGRRIRSGEALEVYVNPQVGWVAGTLQWARSPHTPPSIRVQVTHPEARGDRGERQLLGEMELLLPEDAVCRWPGGLTPEGEGDDD